MAHRRKTIGLRLYNLLRQEVARANRSVKKPLSKKKTDALLKKTLYPKYKQQPFSKIRKTALREDAVKLIKSATRKKNSGSIIYNRMLHELTLLNTSIPDTQKLTIAERRKLVSTVLYPKYKGISYRKIDWKQVSAEITSEIRKLKKDVCDVLAIPPNHYFSINYFEIDDFIAVILPPCIFIAVNAGEFGVTDIFNTKDYNYYDSGVQSITNNVNRAVSNKELPGDTDQIPKYTGEIQLRPGKKNDGNPENYYLEMILVVNDEMVEEPGELKIPRRKRTSAKAKRQRSTRQYINERLKKLHAEKSKVKPIRRRIAQLDYDMKNEIRGYRRLVKNKMISKESIEKQLKNLFNEEKSRLDKYKEKKVIHDLQYNELLNQLKRIFEQE